MSTYSRREMLRMSGLSTLALATQAFSNDEESKASKKHIITLSFDDGFKKSSLLTAEIYEKHKLSACINVIATGHLPDFKSPDEYQVTPKGDFGLWNELQQRGHEIMPHGYKHADKGNMPLQEAKGLVKSCLDYFSQHLKGFEAQKAIFNMPYNSSNPELEAWLANEVMAFRTAGPIINPIPYRGQRKLTCDAKGPGNIEEHLESEIKRLLQLPSGWLIYNTHGLDGEGWGPMRSEFLDRLLGKLLAIDSVAILPTGKALSAVYQT